MMQFQAKKLHNVSLHDLAQNEAERTNTAIGEALATGRPVSPPTDPFHWLTASQIDNMTLKEVEERFLSGKWRILGSWLGKCHIEFMMSLDPGNKISLSMFPVILRNGRSYNFLPNISFRGRRHLLVADQDVRECFVFEASKAKRRSCTTRALLLGVPEVRLRALLWVLQTGRMVSRGSVKLVSCSQSQWHQSIIAPIHS